MYLFKFAKDALTSGEGHLISYFSICLTLLTIYTVNKKKEIQNRDTVQWPSKSANESLCLLCRDSVLTFEVHYQLVMRSGCVNLSLIPGVSCYDVEFKHGIIASALKVY